MAPSRAAFPGAATGPPPPPITMNRPGFTGEFFVQNLCGFLKGDHSRMECVLPFLRRPVANGAV